MKRLLLALLVLSGAAGLRPPVAVAQPAAPPVASTPALWSVSDDDSTVYLLGSVHVLTEAAYPLSAAVEAAYADAEVVAFELDVDAARLAVADPSAVMARGLYTDGTTLADHLAPDLYEDVGAAAATFGLPPGVVDAMRPWFLSLMFSGLAAERAGLTAEHGLDHHFFDRAGVDAKERAALETLDLQTDLFAGLPPEAQAAMLRQALEDLADAEAGFGRLQAAWRAGDTDALEAELGDGLTPELEARLLTDRNRAWLPQIEALLARTDEDALVVVGVGHLVGAGSVVALLEADGYPVVRRD